MSEYHPNARTLESVFLIAQKSIITESVLWSFVCQLISAIRFIHEKHLACRCLFPSKILVTSSNRLRISGVGIFDTVKFDPNMTSHYQVKIFPIQKKGV